MGARTGLYATIKAIDTDKFIWSRSLLGLERDVENKKIARIKTKHQKIKKRRHLKTSIFTKWKFLMRVM